MSWGAVLMTANAAYAAYAAQEAKRYTLRDTPGYQRGLQEARRREVARALVARYGSGAPGWCASATRANGLANTPNGLRRARQMWTGRLR